VAQHGKSAKEARAEHPVDQAKQLLNARNYY